MGCHMDHHCCRVRFSRRLCRPFAEGLFSDGKRVGLIVGYGEFRSGTRYDRILDAGTGKPPLGEIGRYIPYLAFVIPAFSGLRLAKFNIDERQTTSFIGMPVTAHALFWASVGYSLSPLSQANNVLFIVVTLVVALATSLLLVSEIPMFSLKIKSVAWKGNERRYILVGCAVLFVAFFGMLGIAGTILLYILLSIFNKRQ